MKKEFIRIRKVWKQAVLAPVVSNLLFFVIFGVAIADRVQVVEGLDYMSVLIPGLVAMGLMMNSLQNPVFSLVISKFSNNLGELLTLPLSGVELALSYLFGGMIRGLIVGLVTLLVGLIFSPVPFAHPFLILLFTFLLGGIFASFGTILGVVAEDFDQGNFIPIFVIQPMIYLGGVFYSINQLPPLLQMLSKFNPILYLVDGFRYSFLGVSDISIWISLSVALGLFVLFFSVVSWMFHTGYRLKS